MENINIVIDPKTLKGIILGASATFALLFVIFKIAMAFRRYDDSYDYPPPRPMRRPPREGNIFMSVVMILVASAIFSLMLAFRPGEGASRHTEQLDDFDLDSYAFDDENMDEMAPNTYEYLREMRKPLVPDTNVRLVNDNASNAETDHAVHFVQVAALRSLDEGLSALPDYVRLYPNFNVQLMELNDGTLFPVKVLLGYFNSETDARTIAKKVKKPYKRIQ